MDGNGSKKKMIKAIIFDCFGVLAEDGWMPLKRKYVGGNLQMAKDVSDLGKQNEYGMIDNEAHLKLMAEAIGVNKEELRKALDIKVPNEELFSFITSTLKPKYKIGLLTNANFNVLDDLFTPEQKKIFDATVMSYESRLVKPDQRMFELITKRLELEMPECVFVDDQERYCAEADMYGMKTIWYRSFEQFKEELAHIESLESL